MYSIETVVKISNWTPAKHTLEHELASPEPRPRRLMEQNGKWTSPQHYWTYRVNEACHRRIVTHILTLLLQPCAHSHTPTVL